MEAVQRISNVKVNPKTDKPYEDISIINITVKWLYNSAYQNDLLNSALLLQLLQKLFCVMEDDFFLEHCKMQSRWNKCNQWNKVS